MIVPKTFNNEDYHIAQYMVAVADGFPRRQPWAVY